MGANTGYDAETKRAQIETLRDMLYAHSAKLDELKATAEAVEQEWKDQNAVLLCAVEAQKKVVSDFDTRLRELAVEYCDNTGIKQICKGVDVKESISFEYDSEEALEWCKERKMFLALDRVKFNKYLRILKPLDQPPFIETIVTNKAFISPPKKEEPNAVNDNNSLAKHQPGDSPEQAISPEG